jgi:hypothetical protein
MRREGEETEETVGDKRRRGGEIVRHNTKPNANCIVHM